MARRRRGGDHAHRSLRDDGKVECECGAELKDDDAWRRHYERETTAKEREKLEDRAGDDGE